MTINLNYRLIVGLLSLMMMDVIQAGIPLWTYAPMTATTQSVPSNSSSTIEYLLTNQSRKLKVLVMKPPQGLVQITLGDGVCSNPIVLPTKGSSCIFSLQALGYELTKPIEDGPIVCEQGSVLQCYRPTSETLLNLTQGPPIPLPSDCIDIGNNNIQCYVDSNYGFTNMSYALCRSALCHYSQGQPSAVCNCPLITANQGIYSASVGPNDYATSAPVGNTVTSTFSLVNSNGQPPYSCYGSYANCYGVTCTVNKKNMATCICPVVVGPVNFYTTASCDLPPNLVASGTSSYISTENTLTYMYDTFFDGNTPI